MANTINRSFRTKSPHFILFTRATLKHHTNSSVSVPPRAQPPTDPVLAWGVLQEGARETLDKSLFDLFIHTLKQKNISYQLHTLYVPES